MKCIRSSIFWHDVTIQNTTIGALNQNNVVGNSSAQQWGQILPRDPYACCGSVSNGDAPVTQGQR